jgi:hypothetical protein
VALTKVQTALTNTGIVNVLDYGAVGDGSTDDAAAIQAALDSVANRNVTVFFPDGSYRCTVPIEIGMGTKLKGTRHRGADGNKHSRLVFTEGTHGIITPASYTTVPGATAAFRARSITIEDLQISGTTRSGTKGIWWRDTTDATDGRPGETVLRNVTIYLFEFGVDLSGHSDGFYYNTGDIGGCRIGINGGNIDDNISNLFFWDIDDYQIDTSCNRGLYTALELAGFPLDTGARGIQIRTGAGTERGVGEHCTVSHCQSGGNDLINTFYVNGVVGTKIVNNTCHPGAEAIVFDAASEFVCTGNTVKGHGQTTHTAAATPAIWLKTGTLRGIVANNAIAPGSTNGTIGIQIDSGCFDTELSANVFATQVTLPIKETDTTSRTKISSRTVYRTSAITDVKTTTTETTIFSATLPVYTLRARMGLRLRLLGDYLNNTGGASDLTMRVKLGGTTIATSGAVSLAQSASRRAVFLESHILGRGDTSQIGTTRIEIGAAPSVSGVLAAATSDLFGMHSSGGEDSGTELDLTVTVEHGTSSASISARILGAQLEAL